MALTAYQTATRNLLQNPSAPATLYDTTSLNTWINTARGQIAGEGECIRLNATLATVNGTQSYNFSSFNTGVSATNGIAGALNARMVVKDITGGKRALNVWPWEWFNRYYYAVPELLASPTEWAQYAQGIKGSIFLYPTPNAVYALTIDAVCYPIDLADNTTVEAIPYPWTDAIPFFAAYYALMSAQTNARQADAARYFEMYQTFMERARKQSTASVLPYQYEQSGVRIPVAPAGIAIGGGQ